MPRLLRDTIRAFWEILLLVPMPWRAGLVILVAMILLRWLVWRSFPWLIERLARLLLLLVEGIASLLLLPEYLITKQLRQGGRQPLPGTYAIGDTLQRIVGLIHAGTTKLADIFEKQWRLPKRWIVLIVAIPILLWYVRPFLGEITAADYIDRGITWWYSLEGWVLTNEWVPLNRATSDDAVIPRTTVVPRATATPTQRLRRTPTATSAYKIYVVQKGDSLSKIAKRFGVTVEDLVEANRARYPSLVKDPATIEIGWELRIPKR